MSKKASNPMPPETPLQAKEKCIHCGDERTVLVDQSYQGFKVIEQPWLDDDQWFMTGGVGVV